MGKTYFNYKFPKQTFQSKYSDNKQIVKNPLKVPELDHNPVERSEIDFKNSQPLPRVWPHPKMLKIAFFQICCMMSCEVAMERYSPVEHSEMVLKKF